MAEKCPKCGQLNVGKMGPYGPYRACANYPRCDMILNSFGWSDQKTRNARKAAHRVFDRLWKITGGRFFHQRGEAYKQLAEHMGLSSRACHIEAFAVEQCQVVMEWAEAQSAEALKEPT